MPEPTGEQEAFVASTEPCIVVQAFAGTGKSMSIVERVRRHPDRRFLVLAFNRSAAEGMQERMAREGLENAEAKTIHSFAMSWLSHRGVNLDNFKRIPLENFKVQLPDLADSEEENSDVWFVVDEIFKDWCKSSIEDLREFYGRYERFARMREERGRSIEKGLRFLLDEMENPARKLPLRDDTCLKIAAREIAYQDISRRRDINGFDEIVMDEAQDANACAVAMTLSQKRISKSFVGDRFQRIYAWNGCVDAQEFMSGLSPQHIEYTRSFRCPEDVARAARPWLALLGGRGFAGGRGICGDSRHAFIARTRAGYMNSLRSMEEAGMQPEEISLFGGAPDFSDIFGYARLSPAERSSFRERMERIERMDVASLLARLEREGADWALDFEAFWNARKERYAKDGHFVLATAHKAKGAEFEQVSLANDFTGFSRLRGKCDIESLRLVYVGLTRAGGSLSPETRMRYALTPAMLAEVAGRIREGRLRLRDGDKDVTEEALEGIDAII